MSLIICKKRAEKPYRIKEVDINVWTIEELCFYIYNFTILISSDFICQNLLYFIYSDLGCHTLSHKLNAMKQKDESMTNMLLCILDYSTLYSKEELQKFKLNINNLTQMPRHEQIELAADLLFNLEKYEKAIKLYEQLPELNYSKYKKIAFSYAKLQNYDKAIQAFDTGIENLDKIKPIEEDEKLSNAKLDLLKNLYYVFRLNKCKEKFEKYATRVDDAKITDWDIEFIQIRFNVKNDYNINGLDEMFLMEDNFIVSNVSSIINRWKEKYRGLV